jgi:hypothetical protein
MPEHAQEEAHMRHFFPLFVLLAVAGGALLLGEASASAQPYYRPAYGPPPGYRAAPRYSAPYSAGYGYHSHDGFFLRLNIGGGYLTASEDYGGATDTYSGFGVAMGAAFGVAIAPNLILYGEIFGVSVPDPDYGYTGVAPAPLTGLDMTLVGFGPGIAYYVQPINAFFSGTLVFSRISLSESSSDYTLDDTDLGFGLSLMAGKEWWVSTDWGLGIAGQLYVGRMGHHPVDAQGYAYDSRLSALACSLLFSATYN